MGLVLVTTWDTLVIKNTTGQRLPSPWKEAVEKYDYVTEVVV